MNHNNLYRNTQIAGIVKGVFLVIALVIAYLFALNGRYIQVDDDYYFDKWTKSMVEITRYRTIE